MEKSIVESVKSLPPLSKTILDINEVYADEDASLQDLVKVIERDPMIVANLLKVANSPLYSFGREIKSISQAVSLFGMGMTRNITLGNSVRKLLNVDMQPYGISSIKFTEISNMQAMLIYKWYKKIDAKKAEKLYLCAFLQETGKILIASSVIQENETISFQSEVETSYKLSMVEKSYVGVTAAEVSSELFKHWGFDSEFVDALKYSDNPSEASQKVQELSTALNIVKTIVPINQPFSDTSIRFGLKMAEDAGYDKTLLESAIHEILEDNTKRENV